MKLRPNKTGYNLGAGVFPCDSLASALSHLIRPGTLSLSPLKFIVAFCSLHSGFYPFLSKFAIALTIQRGWAKAIIGDEDKEHRLLVPINFLRGAPAAGGVP
jgi:hypothetical protein